MVVLSAPIPDLSSDNLVLYHALDPRLSNTPCLIFHGPSTAANFTQNTSRIQAHVFTPAGFQSYPRLTISPNSPLYAAVNHLPLEKQGDELCRGLAVSLLKYFSEMPGTVKDVMLNTYGPVASKKYRQGTTLFDEMHAAELAGRMVHVVNKTGALRDLHAGLQPRSISWIDVDVVLPPGTIVNNERDNQTELDPHLEQYTKFSEIVQLFGNPVFLPTSKLRRAPSKPTSNQSKAFGREQKEVLHRELKELLSTEERYVLKLRDIATASQELRRAARLTGTSNDPSLNLLFPASLPVILNENCNFLEEVRTAVAEAEKELQEDLHENTNAGEGSRANRAGRSRDGQAAVTLSRLLLDFLPRFSECYQDYLRLSCDFPRVLTTLLLEAGPGFSRVLQERGEQRLRSLLIEPVQRLPRYSLYIDHILNQLPANHTAVNSLLKAKDGIADICSLDTATPDQSQVVRRLRTLIDGWPAHCTPRGRLITSADCLELWPPFHLPTSDRATSDGGIVLLFSDSIVIIRKVADISMSARGITAELDKPLATFASPFSGDTNDREKFRHGLVFCGQYFLQNIRFYESHDNYAVVLVAASSGHDTAAVKNKGQSVNRPSETRVLYLSGPFEGRTSKWSEEVAKAKIEGRFSEAERESGRWTLRSVADQKEGLGIMASIYEYSDEPPTIRPAPSIMIRIGEENARKIGSWGYPIPEIRGTLIPTRDDAYRVDIQGLEDYATTDTVSLPDVLPVLVKRLSDLLRLQSQAQNPVLAASQVSYNQLIISNLKVAAEGDQLKNRSFRPPSPVKMLSNFLGGGSVKERGSPTKQRMPLLSSIPSLPRPDRGLSRVNSKEENPIDVVTQQLASIDLSTPTERISPLQGLEDTFSSYALAIHARRGNIVARSLQNRSFADELVVNEIYNAMLEDPSKHSVAAEVAVDVLFAAFEKFLSIAWKEAMGPIINPPKLDALRDKSFQLFTAEFEVYLRHILDNMGPQNRRAFVGLVRLLADLLDASSSDSDRGALMGTFAEFLVTERDPHEYIPLLDRLVDDFDRLFDGFSRPTSSGGTISQASSMASRSINTGSLSSTTSSFRKRLGLHSRTLSRENSKSELERESKVGSVWRTLSKSTKGTPESVKNSLNRSKSIENNIRLLSPFRPGSRDRPTSRGNPFDGGLGSRPGSAYSNASSSKEQGGMKPSPTPRKKRRSSLSDLQTLQDQPTPAPWSLAQPAPSTPTSRTPSPVKRASTLLYQKENSPSTARNTLAERAHNIQSDEINITSYRPSKPRVGSTVQNQNGGLREKPTLVNGVELSPKKESVSPQKLRLQSPQKLRERLQNEQKVIQETQTSLQAELSKIGEEMSSLTLQSSPSRSSRPHLANELRDLTTRIAALESELPGAVFDLDRRVARLQRDLESSLVTSETKSKKLDDLLKEASAENEALYERFNDELAKVLKGVRAGRAEEESSRKLKEAHDMVLKLKKENTMLKRDNANLRSIVRGHQHLASDPRG